jgi:Skp family chaperone for outer membrane proteins
MTTDGKVIRLVMLALGLLCATPAAWATKIAVVDTAKVVEEYSKTPVAQTRVKKRFAGKEAALGKINEQLQRQQNELNTKKGVIPAGKYDALNAKFQGDKDAYQAMSSDYQNAVRESILNDIKEVVAQIAKAEKYDAVFDKEGILYGGEDITYKVLDQLSKK